MPFDPDTGEWVDPEDEEGSVATAEEPETEKPQSDIGEYIRRAHVQNALFGKAGLPEKEPVPDATASETNYAMPERSTYQPGPRMQEFKKAIEEMSLHQDYKPSVLRRVVSGIGGAAAGFAGGPAAGTGVQHEIENQPYEKRLSNYQQQLAQKGQLAQMEAGGNQAARQYYLDLAKIQHENAQSRAEESRRSAEGSRGRRFDWMISPAGQEFELNKARIQHPGTSRTEQLWDVVDDTGKHKVAVQSPGGAFKASDGTIIPPEHVDASKTKKLGVGAPGAITLHPVQGPNGQVTWQTTENAVGQPAPKGADEIAAAQRNTELQTERSQNHLDKSYQFHTSELDKLQRPISDYGARLGRLEDTINQGTIQADALIAPELLSVMAGGQGSGVRMNEAEISRIVGGRTSLDSLKVALSKLSTDPKNAEGISPAQRGQIRELLKSVRQKLNDKNAALSEAGNSILGSKDEMGHRTALNTAKQKLAAIDSGSAQTNTPTGGVPKPGETFNGQKVLKVTEIHK